MLNWYNLITQTVDNLIIVFIQEQLENVNQDLKDSNKKIQALKSQDTLLQLRAAQETIEQLTIERDEVKQKLNISQSAEQRAKQQLMEEKTKGATTSSEELEQLKIEAAENEELWKEKLMEAEKVSHFVNNLLNCVHARFVCDVYFLENSCCP